MMVVSVGPEGPDPIGVPELLFDDEYYFADTTFNYAVGRDGRFLMITDPSLAPPRQIKVVRNWSEELKARVPPN